MMLLSLGLTFGKGARYGVGGIRLLVAIAFTVELKVGGVDA